ncbi:hypothetical protein [Streptomyces sp. S.PNR 29]|nr:hypothetical protein [Streptomyces sp. S.PNR 29]MDN0198554.1 hypothetical protein [Streptomyces sp. S.PNR 29]
MTCAGKRVPTVMDADESGYLGERVLVLSASLYEQIQAAKHGGAEKTGQ